MDANVVEHNVRVLSQNGKEQPGQVKVQTWDKKERTARGFKFWGMAWGCMVLSIFLPIAHFFLVPAFFLAGPIVAYFVFRQESVVLGGLSTCPQCLKPLPLVRGPNTWPMEDMCSLCQTHVTVKKTESSPR